MTITPRSHLSGALLSSALMFSSVAPAGAPVEIVESIPLETVLDNPDIRNTREVWLEMIHGARQTLDIEQFYISNAPGEALDTILTAIGEAGARGVRVRLIVDSRMFRTYPEPATTLGRSPGISLRVMDFGKAGGGIQHAKYIIADDREVFIGSQNFDWRALSHIHELGIRIADAGAARTFGRVFAIDWTLAAEIGKLTPPEPSAEPVTSPFRIPFAAGDTALMEPTWSPARWSPDSIHADESALLRLIDGAREHLFLQFLTYSVSDRSGGPYTVIDSALRRAAQRGVEVRLIVADWEKGTPAEKSLADLASVPNISVRFSVIPDWSGGYIPFGRVEHCKYVTADGTRFWLGSANCERNYFHASRNVGVACEHPALTRTLERIFTRSWDGPYLEPVEPGKKYAPRKHGE
jgi:phosphatidylserine/phosphatidylglycerophosphate/cardiolipin synthase-like enzyme